MGRMNLNKAVEKFTKDFKKSFKKATKSKNVYVYFTFPIDRRYECLISRLDGVDEITVRVYKDCASFTKNGDYHLVSTFTNSEWKKSKLYKKTVRNEFLQSALKAIGTYHCTCKKDQKAKAKTMVRMRKTK